MRLHDLLTEARDGYLYRAVPLKMVVWDLKRDWIEGGAIHQLNGSTLSGTSFTRSYDVALRFFRDFNHDWTEEFSQKKLRSGAVLVLDQAALTHRHRIEPVNYFDQHPEAKRKRGWDEDEELVIGKIKPLSRYLVSVNVTSEDMAILSRTNSFAASELRKHPKFNRVIPRAYEDLYEQPIR